MVEQVIDIIRYFVIIQIGIFHDYTLTNKVIVEMGTTCHYNLFESILEFDISFVTFEFDNFEVAYAVTCQRSCYRPAEALEPDHYHISSILEQGSHSIAQIPHCFVE
jgi:hypothetical protein